MVEDDPKREGEPEDGDEDEECEHMWASLAKHPGAALALGMLLQLPKNRAMSAKEIIELATKSSDLEIRFPWTADGLAVEIRGALESCKSLPLSISESGRISLLAAARTSFTSEALLDFYVEKEAVLGLAENEGEGAAEEEDAREESEAKRPHLADDDELLDPPDGHAASHADAEPDPGAQEPDSMLKKIRAKFAQQITYVILRAWREDPSRWLDRDEIATLGVQYGVFEDAGVADSVRRSLGRTFDFGDPSSPVQKDASGMRYQAKQWAAVSGLLPLLAEHLNAPPPPRVPDVLPSSSSGPSESPAAGKKPRPPGAGRGAGRGGGAPPSASGVAPLITLGDGTSPREAGAEAAAEEPAAKPPLTLRRPTGDEVIRHMRPSLRRVLYAFISKHPEAMTLHKAWEVAQQLGVAEGSTEALQLVLSQSRKFKFEKYGLEFPIAVRAPRPRGAGPRRGGQGPTNGSYGLVEWAAGLVEPEELRRRLDEPVSITLSVVNNMVEKRDGPSKKRPRASAPAAPIPPRYPVPVVPPEEPPRYDCWGPPPAMGACGPPPSEPVLVRYRRPLPNAPTHHAYCTAAWRLEELLDCVRRDTGVPDIAHLVAADGSCSSRIADLLHGAGTGHTAVYRAVTRAELRACDGPDEAAPVVVRVQRPGDPTWTRVLLRRGMGLEEVLAAVRAKLRSPAVVAVVDGEGGRVPGVEEMLVGSREVFVALTEMELRAADIRALLPRRRPAEPAPGPAGPWPEQGGMQLLAMVPAGPDPYGGMAGYYGMGLPRPLVLPPPPPLPNLPNGGA